ncbi:ROK family transcriptional regulator [Kribbella alba]|uniref:ROK family transcriptional regulator n=1 Tax=Kribbella alba TaxID=190197 RepID=A0ABN2FL15_9ACTN
MTRTPSRAATPRTARLINDRAAFALLLERGPLSRTELQRLTGLSHPTVSDLVDRLEAAGVIAPAGESQVRRRGPNALLYGLVADRAHVAGVEVLPDVVLASVTDVTGRQVGAAQLAQDTAAEPHDLVHRAITEALADATLTADRLRSVVIGTPGLVDPATGDISFVGALPTWHANLLPGLRDSLGGVPVLVENEVNLVGLAEHRLGAARGRDTFALLSFSSGIGMALVLNGHLHRGTSGGAGELSYLPADQAGRLFPELVAGGAVLALAKTHGIRPKSDNAAAAVTAAVGGAAGGKEFLDELADRIAFGAAGVCAVLDPGFLVLAGTIGRAGGEALAERVAERVNRTTPLSTAVAPGTVDGNPVLRGAVLIALDLLHEETFAQS